MSVIDFSVARSEIEALKVEDIKIADLTHPEYRDTLDNWEKWRRTYEGGDEFIRYYLKKFSIREETDDFERRQEITYVPAFAKAAVNDVKDAIFQRIADVSRKGGPASYQNGVKGLEGGVDLAGTTMNSFIGTIILPELLTMKKVGVFVDMPQLPGDTLMDSVGVRPYLYHYTAESILNWELSGRSDKTYTKLLLKDTIYKSCAITGLPTEKEIRYRYMWVENNYVNTQFFNEDSEPVTRFHKEGIDVIQLNIPIIPFILFEITDSLLRDVANYQIALLNLASSDIAYSLQSNFPFYTEQFDPRAENLFRRPVGHNKVGESDDSVQIVQGGERADTLSAKNQEIEIGSTIGRRFPKGLEFPRFIHPSSEPLMASMDKQKELKEDIRRLVKLAVTDLSPSKMASAESKGFDERGLEAGLSAIGLELEQGERLIAKYWEMYGQKGNEKTVIHYPQKYSLQTDEEKRKEAKDLLETAKIIPSVSYKKAVMKRVAEMTLSTKITNEELQKIQKEIEKTVVVADPEVLHRDIELALIDPETASLAMGYPKGSVEKAARAHAERVRRIAESQMKARGVTDLGGVEDKSRDEKMNKDEENVPSKKTRGDAK